MLEIARNEYKAAAKAGMMEIIEKTTKKKAAPQEEEVVMPPKRVVEHAIPGIDILELENACKVLWKAGIYSESGMGCTGPIVLVPTDECEKALEELKKAEYL